MRKALFVALILLQISSCSKDDPSTKDGITLIPSFGTAGRRIVIQSNDAFSGDISDQLVKFSRAAGHIISATNNAIAVRVPINAGSGTITIVSNGKTFTGPAFEFLEPVKVDYFVRFKENGTFVEGIAQTYETIGENCTASSVGACGQLMFYVQGHFKEGYFEINLAHNNTSESLYSLKGLSIPIRPKALLPAVTFGFNKITGSLTSDDAQTTGVFKITNLTYHNSSLNDYDVYDAEGTFECTIYDKVNDQTSVITEGTFRIPLAAMTE